jgi:hypothetical protein
VGTGRLLSKEYCDVSISISGQNARWAQINAYQPPSTVRSGQNGGWNSIGQATPSSGSASNVPAVGGTTGALSDSTSFALMAFGGWGNGSANSTQAAGQSSGATSDAASATPASTGLTSPTSTGQAGITQAGTISVTQLIADLQSMLSALTGTPTSSASGTGSSGTTGTTGTTGSSGTTGTTDTSDTSDTSANTGTVGATGLSNTVLKDLRAVSFDIASIAAASGATQPGSAGGTPSGPPPWLNDITNGSTISNSGTIAANTGDWMQGNSKRLQQQFALSAYTSGSMSGLDSSATSSLSAISV